MDTDYVRPMDSSHEALLKTALKLESNEDLPQNVVDFYWEIARTARRLHYGISSEMLIMIAVLSGRATPEDPVSFLDHASSLPRGAAVLAKFRNQWKWGSLIGVNGKKIVVALNDDVEQEREFLPTSVRMPTEEEKAMIGV